MIASPLQTDFFTAMWWSTKHVFTVRFNCSPFSSMQGQSIVFERHFDRCSSFSKSANANSRYKQALKIRISLEIIDLFGLTNLVELIDRGKGPRFCSFLQAEILSLKNYILSRNFRNSNLEIDLILSELIWGDDTRFDFRKQKVPVWSCSVRYQQYRLKSGSYARNSFPNLEFNRKRRSHEQQEPNNPVTSDSKVS